jgi:hypothetical protein
MTHLRLDRTSLCLPPQQLLLFAASPMGDETYPLYARHIGSCDDCAAKVAALRAAARAAERGAHLAELDVAGLADRSYEALLTDRRVPHLASCRPCRATYAALCEMLDDEHVDDALRELGSSTDRRPVRLARSRRHRVAAGIGAAAAALLIAVASRLHDASVTRNQAAPGARTAAEPLRHATISTAAAPRLVAPSGAIARVDTLRWTEVPRADLYHVVVYDSNGAVAWQADASAALAVVPDSISASWTGRHSWFVKARTSVDRWVASEFSEFDLREQPR